MDTLPPVRHQPYDTSEPSPLGEVLSKLFARRGYGQALAQRQLDDLWTTAAGPEIALKTRVLNLRNGVLNVAVGNSALLGELASYHKQEILLRLQADRAGVPVRDLKFKLQGDIRRDKRRES